MDTYLKPNIQLFAEKEEKDPETPPAGDLPPDDTGDGLPKSQEELDALLKSRMAREKKVWEKQRAAQAQPPAQPPLQQPLQRPATPPPTGQPALSLPDPAIEGMKRELLQKSAEITAYQSNVKPDAVEDAVLLAMHAAEKDGEELDEEGIAEALKEVLKRHPEWKAEQKQGKPGFRVGAGGSQGQTGGEDAIASIFGNKK